MKDSETIDEMKGIFKELSVGKEAKESIEKTFEKTKQGEEISEEEIAKVKEAAKELTDTLEKFQNYQ